MTLRERLRRRMVRQNRIYIMPTFSGILYLGCVVILVMTAATYNNNLIFILTFFLFAVFAIALLQTHYNIKGVRLNFVSSGEGFAEEPIAIHIEMEQERPRQKFNLRARPTGKRFTYSEPAKATLSALEMRRVLPVIVTCKTRGIFEVPEMILETTYPLGLFRAWKVFRPEGHVTVYPKPAGTQALNPEHQDFGDEELGMRPSPEGDFGELKNYLAGESYHQIAWKHYARTQELYSKVHWGEEHPHFDIPWRPRGDFETDLQQMSEWIRLSLKAGASFAMDLPEGKIDAGMGEEHGRLCWRALAALKKGRDVA